ncbi:unnamed protein product, partial [Brugia timori]|uniref:Uncharacterized protein n=1 Tax=Brugia timori TaxID=42155 RepID=A0A0R3Q437_9BILA
MDQYVEVPKCSINIEISSKYFVTCLLESVGRAKKILEHNRNKQRRKEERELKTRQERIRQAQETRKRDEQEKKHADSTEGFGGFGM